MREALCQRVEALQLPPVAGAVPFRFVPRPRCGKPDSRGPFWAASHGFRVTLCPAGGHTWLFGPRPCKAAPVAPEASVPGSPPRSRCGPADVCGPRQHPRRPAAPSSHQSCTRVPRARLGHRRSAPPGCGRAGFPSPERIPLGLRTRRGALPAPRGSGAPAPPAPSLRAGRGFPRGAGGAPPRGWALRRRLLRELRQRRVPLQKAPRRDLTATRRALVFPRRLLGRGNPLGLRLPPRRVGAGPRAMALCVQVGLRSLLGLA